MSSITNAKRKLEKDQDGDGHVDFDVDDNDKDEQPTKITKKTGSKRGRPRVEHRDANAIERRRTQIRKAQRLYRFRKESTISELKAQNAELHRKLRDATVELQAISDRFTIEHDVRKSTLREDLYQTITKLMELDGDPDSAKQDTTSEENNSPAGSDLTRHVPETEGTHGVTRGSFQELPTVVGVEQSSSEDTSQIHHERVFAENHDVPWSTPFQVSSAVIPSQPARRESLPFTQIPRHILAMPTFSWQETTFSRRLLRHSHESCLRHMENPSDQYADWLERVRYSLAFMSQDALIQKLKFSVSRPRGDPLEDWSMPMLHIGGSGLRFSSSNIESTGDYRSEFDRNVGPFQIPTAAIPIPPSAYPDGVADYLNLRGAWMDHRDVEAYLRHKGLKISAAESTIVYEVPVSNEQIENNSLSQWIDSDAWGNRNDGRFLDFMDLNGSPSTTMQLNQSGDNAKALISGTTSKKVLLSIDRLIESLNQKAVCLGRAPGYKQTDVDAAFDFVLAKATLVAV